MSKKPSEFHTDDIPVLMPVLPHLTAREGWEGQGSESKAYCQRVEHVCKKVRILYRKAHGTAIDNEGLMAVIERVAEREGVPVQKLVNVITRGTGKVPHVWGKRWARG